MANPSDYVIVDACIARSVGTGNIPSTRIIREVIEMLKDGPIGICLTPLLRQEWEKHASRHMRAWLVHMVSRSRVKYEKDRQVRDFRIAIKACFIDSGSDDDKLRAVLKDAHLTECAILTRRAVLSRDDTQRRLLIELSTEYPRVSLVQWVNPEVLYPACVAWLRDGCVDSTLGQIA